jgi:DNA polymerase III subunit gamma/tau
MLTREAWNALLKILEEPPPGVIFVFATTEPQKIASTAAPVLSRLQRFDFRRIGPSAMRARLRAVLRSEGLDAEEDALALIARYADGGMRDALSVLDQCLSFGEGPVSAASVRQVLGLIDDEQYAEALRAVAERDTAAIFPLVDALVNAGADLAEFMTGMADLLRAVLMTESGAEPEGLTDTLRQAIGRSRGKLEASDLVRMLGLLAEAETAIRRSASARLIVETLLLRWTLMDRVVELEAIIRQSGQSVGRSGGQSGGQSAPPREPAAPTVRAPDRQSAGPSVLTLESLVAAWPELILAARGRSNLLGQALEATTPVLVQSGQVQLTAGPEQAVLVDGLQRQLQVLDELIGARFATRVKVRVTLGTPASGSEPPKRLTDEVLRNERLDRLRRLDPALDTVANELDLEIVDESPRSP